MNSVFCILIFFGLTLSIVGGLPLKSVLATSGDNFSTTASYEADTLQVTVEYENNTPISKTVINEGGMDVTPHLEGDAPNLYTMNGSNPISPLYIPREGNMNYYFIDSFNASSAFVDTSSEWIFQYVAAVTPAKLAKSIWGAAAGSAIFNTFHNPPSRRYYTTKIYQAQDNYYYYGKEVTYEYSNSARTNLTKSDTFVYKIRK
ncbi:hypothetical protein VBD025_01040 [Virgibacillus flavescens]|uniref:hypothetical protein n=1 Tax=Virgibacillus flavescens TaxID=1611422 RepID=UPI003D351AAD